MRKRLIDSTKKVSNYFYAAKLLRVLRFCPLCLPLRLSRLTTIRHEEIITFRNFCSFRSKTSSSLGRRRSRSRAEQGDKKRKSRSLRSQCRHQATALSAECSKSPASGRALNVQSITGRRYDVSDPAELISLF